MATITKNISVKAAPETVWSALTDIGNVHRRLASGFVIDTQMENGERIVTFANGFVVRERIVSLDDSIRRIAYSAVGGQLAHHNASFQVVSDGTGGTVLIWITDLLPDEMAETIGAMIEGGAEAIKQTLDAADS